MMKRHLTLRSNVNFCRVEGWRSAWFPAAVFQPYPSLTMACGPGRLLGQSLVPAPATSNRT
jgi:hypothetical protein